MLPSPARRARSATCFRIAALGCLILPLLMSSALGQTVFFGGNANYAISLKGSKVNLLVDQVLNSSGGNTGVVQLELWAMPPGGPGCGGGVATIVAVDNLGTMAPGTTRTNINDTVPIQSLPHATGTYPLGLWITQQVGSVISHQNCVELSGALHIVSTPSCAVAPTVTPTTGTIAASGGTGAVTVTAAAGCAWTGVSNTSWLTVSVGGTGNGTSTYLAASSNASYTRTGYLTVAGQEVAVTQSLAPTGTVVEYYNPDLNNYFITADPTEQAFVDTGAVGRWQRTTFNFKAGGPNLVCRFYGNTAINPATGAFYGPNSHFYTADPTECADLKAIFTASAKSWKFESNDFATTPAANQVCPDGLVPVYRAYNNGFPRIDSNHRITSNFAAYQQTVAAGWTGEGVRMCAPL